MKNEIEKIAIVGGCGHVGLPLGIALAHRNFKVTLVDINEHAVETVNSGKLPFHEDDGEKYLNEAQAEKRLTATTSPEVLKDMHCVIFVTGTPVDEHSNPRVSDVEKVIMHYMKYLNNKLVILRSTVYPGVCDIIDRLLVHNHGHSRLAFCPERIVQGQGIKEIFTLPQIVAATTRGAEEDASFIFSKVAPKILHMLPIEAELAKLMTNSWRYLEFAIANQFYTMVESRGISFWRVFQGVKEDYPRAKHFPKPGLAAGPCLFKDTMQLASFHDNNFYLGHIGMLINEGLPNFLVQQMEKQIGSLKGKKVGILGMTFKPNNDDTRESLSFKVKKLLEIKSAHALTTDPYVPGLLSLRDVLDQADGIIMGVPHREYLNLKFHQPLVDCWGTYEKPDLTASPLEVARTKDKKAA